MPVAARDLKIAGHLILLYISWGSVYICFQIVLEVFGAFSLCGIRMLIAGFVLALYLWIAGKWRPVRKSDLINALWLGLFMVVIGGGFVSKGQEYIPSGIAAVVNGSTPVSMALAAWLFAGEPRPTFTQWLGLFGGIVGLLLLVSARGSLSYEHNNIIGILWIYLGTLGWIGGSLLSKKGRLRINLPELQTCVLIFLLGGLESLLIAIFYGEPALYQWQNINFNTVFAFAWMIIVCTIIAYACYFWLLNHASTMAAISYEYVIPVVGLLLGWLLGNEAVNLCVIVACFLLVSAVFFVLHKNHDTMARKL